MKRFASGQVPKTWVFGTGSKRGAGYRLSRALLCSGLPEANSQTLDRLTPPERCVMSSNFLLLHASQTRKRICPQADPPHPKSGERSEHLIGHFRISYPLEDVRAALRSLCRLICGNAHPLSVSLARPKNSLDPKKSIVQTKKCGLMWDIVGKH